MIRRITTGLVAIAFARTSDVTEPFCSAMCSRMWSTRDNLLSLLMILHMLRDNVEVVKWLFLPGARKGKGDRGHPI